VQRGGQRKEPLVLGVDFRDLNAVFWFPFKHINSRIGGLASNL
jgi:hypothetical protein